MNQNLFRGALVAALFLSPAALVGGCGDAEDCQENTFACEGNVLQRCQDGAFVDVEDCGANECEADAGHCHEAGEHDEHAM